MPKELDLLHFFCSSQNENKIVGHERIQLRMVIFLLTSDGVSTGTNPAGEHCELMGREVRVSSYTSLTCVELNFELKLSANGEVKLLPKGIRKLKSDKNT